jgi:hypothetical protein
MAHVKRSPAVAMLAVLVLGVLPALYFGGYVWARLTHRLVWYGHFVARPHAGSGLGWSDWELFFAPPSLLEEVLRNHLP